MADLIPVYPPGLPPINKAQIDRTNDLLIGWDESAQALVTRPFGDVYGWSAQVNHVASATLNSTAEGKLHTNIGAGLNLTLTLYAVTGSNIGDELIIYRSTGAAAPYWLQVTPNGTDRLGRYAAGVSLKLMEVGCYLHLRVIETGVWGIVSHGGLLVGDTDIIGEY